MFQAVELFSRGQASLDHAYHNYDKVLKVLVLPAQGLEANVISSALVRNRFCFSLVGHQEEKQV
jgi:hypothetical protein